MTTITNYHVRRAGPLFGAEIFGLDLSRPLDDAATAALRGEFLQHKVLVFRDQHLTPDQHVAAARIFGEPFAHPTAEHHEANRFVYPYDVRSAGKASVWHVGGLWRNPPFSIESLAYQEVPEIGGHTLWADLQAAYDGLSEPVKQLLEPISAIYDANPANYAQGRWRTATTDTIEQPVVLQHPDTGRRGLFISTGALGLTGVSATEGQAILDFLLTHASSPNYTIRFGWQPGDFVLWDNRATWHYAIDDYGSGPRRYRKVIATRADRWPGSRPTA